MACEANRAGLVDGEQVREHGQHVLAGTGSGIACDVGEALACVDFQQCRMDQAHLRQTDSQLLVACGIDVGRGLVVDALVVDALDRFRRAATVDEADRRAAVAVVRGYHHNAVAGERAADVRVCVS